MGNKVNPTGFRIGVSRKWTSSWFSPSNVQKSFDSAQAKNTLLSKGVVSSRGGFSLSSFEDILRGFFKRYLYVSRNRSRRFLPLEVYCIKGAGQHLFIFLTYVKLRGRQPKKLKRKKAIQLPRHNIKSSRKRRNKYSMKNWSDKTKSNGAPRNEGVYSKTLAARTNNLNEPSDK